METRRLIAIVIALGALTLGILTACGGGTDAAGTLGGEVTIGTGTNPTSTPVVTGDVDPAATTAADAGATTAADTGATTAAAAEGDAAAGAAVFSSAGCGGCHTLAAAGSAGNVGPNLDELKPDYAAVLYQVTNGGGGMPVYGDTLSVTDIQNVSAYVSQNAGK
ncbi:MAG: c-type cytochrome [Thermoleophilia bacterium]